MAPTLTLHALPPSHPCMTVDAALRLKGLEFERIDFAMTGEHTEKMPELYGDGNTTVPGLLIDDEAVHGSSAILQRLDELQPDPVLYPSDAVREAERWGEGELQDLGRRLPWSALYFRPEAMGTLGGAEPLDGPGTDYAMKFVRASWKYHGITAERLHEDLAGLPEKLDRIDELCAEGVIGGDQANAADLQIGASLTVLRIVGDLRPLIDGRPLEKVATHNFPVPPGHVPAGAYPAGWVPSP